MSTYNYCIFDTETNGLPIKNDYSNVYMTQIAIIITDGKTNFVEKEFLIDGDYEITNEITDLTGITKEKTKKQGLSFEYIWNYINSLLKKYNCVFSIAHNNYFDLNVIKQEYRRMKNLTFNKFHKKNLDEELFLIQKFNNLNIFHKTFFNKYKFNLNLLKQIDNSLSSEQDKNEKIKNILKIIQTFNKNKKLYNDYFFQLIPLCSLQYFRKKLIKNEKLINYKLQTIYNSLYNIEYKQTHTALDDCWILQKCFGAINLNILNCINY